VTWAPGFAPVLGGVAVAPPGGTLRLSVCSPQQATAIRIGAVGETGYLEIPVTDSGQQTNGQFQYLIDMSFPAAVSKASSGSSEVESCLSHAVRGVRVQTVFGPLVLGGSFIGLLCGLGFLQCTEANCVVLPDNSQSLYCDGDGNFDWDAAFADLLGAWVLEFQSDTGGWGGYGKLFITEDADGDIFISMIGGNVTSWDIDFDSEALVIHCDDTFSSMDISLRLDAAVRCANHEPPGSLQLGYGGWATHAKPALDSLLQSDFGSVTARHVGF